MQLLQDVDRTALNKIANVPMQSMAQRDMIYYDGIQCEILIVTFFMKHNGMHAM